MPNIKVEIHDEQVTAAFNRLIQAGEEPGPLEEKGKCFNEAMAVRHG